MFIEDQEFDDWKITPEMDNTTRKQKSIEAYWLDRWYEQMKDITFPTVIYNSTDTIPDILPFDKCMVRHENKSPKDSEHWGPSNTKEQMFNMFYTSLRCKTNAGTKYCVREWVELTDEYRCFWNGQLVAISSELKTEPPIEQILDYIKNISKYIYFHKCVFDIAHLKNTNELIFVEYNSWESNSGAHRFNWIDDTEVFYQADSITIRWLGSEKKVPLLKPIQKVNIDPINLSNCIVLKPTEPSNWLLTEKFIYISNDVWLGRFSLDLKPLNFTRGMFRYNNLQLCDDGSIYAEPIFYYYDLTLKRTKSRLVQDTNQNINNKKINFKYGCLAIDKENNVVAIRMLDDCSLVISK